MTVLGIIFMFGGFVCWFIGAGRVADRALKRLGVWRSTFPFTPRAIPFGKLNRQEWRELGFVFLASMLLLGVGSALLKA